MEKIKLPKPDYKSWAKAETWSVQQAAFLLHGIDPNFVRSVRLAERDIPPVFAKPQQTYSLLRSIPWRERHPKYHFPTLGNSPIAFITEAKERELPLPKVLYKAVCKRYQDLQAKNESLKEVKTITVKEVKEIEITTRERKSLLRAIGILIKLFLDEKNKSSRNRSQQQNKLSAVSILQLILEKADELGIEAEGLKSFDRKITEALEILEQESSQS